MAKDKVTRIQARAAPYIAPRRALHPDNGTFNGKPVRQAVNPCSLIQTPPTEYCTEYFPDCTARLFFYEPVIEIRSCERLACVTGKDIRSTHKTPGVFFDTRCAVSTTLTRHIEENYVGLPLYSNIPGTASVLSFLFSRDWLARNGLDQNGGAVRFNESQLGSVNAVMREVDPYICIQGETNPEIARQIRQGLIGRPTCRSNVTSTSNITPTSMRRQHISTSIKPSAKTLQQVGTTRMRSTTTRGQQSKSSSITPSTSSVLETTYQQPESTLFIPSSSDYFESTAMQSGSSTAHQQVDTSTDMAAINSTSIMPSTSSVFESTYQQPESSSDYFESSYRQPETTSTDIASSSMFEDQVSTSPIYIWQEVTPSMTQSTAEQYVTNSSDMASSTIWQEVSTSPMDVINSTAEQQVSTSSVFESSYQQPESTLFIPSTADQYVTTSTDIPSSSMFEPYMTTSSNSTQHVSTSPMVAVNSTLGQQVTTSPNPSSSTHHQITSTNQYVATSFAASSSLGQLETSSITPSTARQQVTSSLMPAFNSTYEQQVSSPHISSTNTPELRLSTSTVTTMAASTASLLATTASAFLSPVPTVVIAASAPSMIVTGVAVAAGAFGAGLAIAAATYAGYKLVQHCKSTGSYDLERDCGNNFELPELEPEVDSFDEGSEFSNDTEPVRVKHTYVNQEIIDVVYVNQGIIDASVIPKPTYANQQIIDGRRNTFFIQTDV